MNKNPSIPPLCPQSGQTYKGSYNIKIFMKLEDEEVEHRTAVQNRWDARKQRRILNGSIEQSSKSKERKI